MPRGIRNDGQPRAKAPRKTPQQKLDLINAEIEKTETKLAKLKEEKKAIETLMDEEQFKKLKTWMVENSCTVEQAIEALSRAESNPKEKE